MQIVQEIRLIRPSLRSLWMWACSTSYENWQDQLCPISIAIVQVFVPTKWAYLSSHQEKIQKLFKQAILPCHILAHMMHPKYMGIDLSTSGRGFRFTGRDPNFFPAAIAFQRHYFHLQPGWSSQWPGRRSWTNVQFSLLDLWSWWLLYIVLVPPLHLWRVFSSFVLKCWGDIMN